MTASNLPKLAPGDRLLRVITTAPHRQPVEEPRLNWMTVTKVGRQFGEAVPEGEEVTKWGVTRFDLKTGASGDGFGRKTVRFFTDEGHFRATEAADSAWDSFRRAASNTYTRPAGASAEDIAAATKLLKLEVGK